MDIYENVIIGNFLFGLGAEFGLNAKEEASSPISVNLLQQTPLDRGSGDVLIQGARAMKLLEFKRAANDSIKEVTKLTLLKRRLLHPDAAGLETLSREVHWYIETHNASEFTIRIVPYLDFQTQDHGPSMKEFMKQIFDELSSSNGGDRTVEFQRYLDIVASSQGAHTGGSGGLLFFSDAAGSLHYAVVEDLRHLGYSLQKFHEHHQERQKQITLEYQRTQEKIFSREIEERER